MKNHFLFTFLMLLFMGGTATAQCDVGENCEALDLDFQTSGNGADISHLENWSYSHGSASVSSNGFWLWSYNNNGEGINYSGYNFVAGNEYTICFVANTATHDNSAPNANATFNIVGTNGPVVGSVTGSGGGPIPPVPGGSMNIVSEPFGNFPNPGTGTYTYTFTATSNFNNLWFYPSSSTLPQVEIGITSIVICRVIPCLADFTVCLKDIGSGSSIIDVSLNNSDHTLANMTVIENNVQVYNGAPISYIGTAGNSYTICVVAINNKTGEECEKCYSFCISKGKFTEEKGRIGSQGTSFQMDNKKSSMPAEFKDKPLEKDLGVTIAPNPSNRNFEISSSSTDIKMTTVKVFDLNLKEVCSNELSDGQNRTNLDLKDQPSGIYIVKIQYSDGSMSQEKIVLEK